jgi:hypothetical protein
LGEQLLELIHHHEQTPLGITGVRQQQRAG